MYKFAITEQSGRAVGSLFLNNIQLTTVQAVSGGAITLLHADDFQTNPLSFSKTGDGTKTWGIADDFDPNFDVNPTYSQVHARVGNACARAQLTLTKTPVNGVYTQFCPNGDRKSTRLN